MHAMSRSGHGALRLATAPALAGIAAISIGTVLATVPSSTWLGTGTLSLAAGVTALTMMAAAALLGGRLQVVESLFGGLDRVYETHKWLGVWALVTASVHLVFKAGAEGWVVAPILELPGPLTRLVRQLSYVALVVIVMLALNRAIPYRTWRWWHKLSGPLFLVVVLHWLSFRSPLALASPAGIWMAVMATLGVVAAFYKLLLYPFVSSHAEYRVTSVEAGPAGVRLEMSPVGRALAFQAGQFGFLTMKEHGLREPHPFTIAAAGGERVRFVIRALGDYTEALVARVRVGMLADVHAPFGRFQRSAGATAEAWVAGGVGISPFLAWLDDPASTGLERVTLYYFYTPGRELPAADTVAELARARGAHCVPLAGRPGDGAFDQHFAELASSAGGDLTVYACGPRGLIEHVRTRMRAAGIKESRLHYERFNFR